MPSATDELTAPDVAAVVQSILASLVADFDASRWQAGEPLERLGADSLNLVEVATEVSRFFRLHETGMEDLLLRRRGLADWVDVVLTSWSASSRRLTFVTSGSTGKPTECTHPWAWLIQEIHALRDVFAGRARIVGTVARHHIYGFLFTVLLPRALQVPFVDRAGRLPFSLINSLQAGDLLVSFPSRWADVAAAGVALPAGIQGSSSTSPCPAELIVSLRALGLDRLVEVYGSSETAGIGWRDDPSRPYRLLPHWSLAPDGRLVRLADGQPVALEAPDHLVRSGDGVVPAGRRDRAVQVGGVNVWPARVAAKLRSHELVADCAVRPMRADEGGRLKGFVVLRDQTSDVSVDRDRLQRWIRETLPPPERPVRLRFGPALPTSSLGKDADWD